MGKAIINGNAIFGNVHIGGGGGGTPTLTFNITPASIREMYIGIITGTDVNTKCFEFTADSEVNVSIDDLQVWTDTGSNDGYIALMVNDVIAYRYSLTTNSYVTIQFDEVTLSANDELAIVVGFDNYHSNVKFYVKN